MLRSLLIIALAAAAPAQELAPRPPALPDPLLPARGNPALDVRHYRLELAIDPERRFGEGLARLRLQTTQALRSVELDFHHMLEAQSVRIDGQLVEARQSAHRLQIPLAEEVAAGRNLTVEVRYRGLFPQDESQGEVVGLLHDGQSLVAYLQPDGAHHWFPCNDHPSDKATYSLVIEAPGGQTVAALGRRVAQGPARRAGWQRSEWETTVPTASYLVSLAVGPWVAVPRADSSPPIVDYLEEADRDRLEDSLATVPAMLRYFEGLFGPYPFEKYGHVTTRSWIGGMEDQTLTVLGREEALRGDPALLAHELAHQWFGNLVSPYQWCDLWLNEGWATWAELLWAEHAAPKGVAELRESWRRSAFRLALREHPYTLAAPDPAQLFDGDLVYNKGGLVLDLLADYLGREAFLAAARSYLAAHACGNARTVDFQHALEAATGEDLQPFFRAWVQANTLPVLHSFLEPPVALGQTAAGEPAGPWRVTVRLEQIGTHHPMSLALELQGDEAPQRHRLRVRFTEPQCTASVVLPWKPSRVVLDPEKRAPWVPAEPRDD